MRRWRDACLSHPAAQQVTRERIVKLYYDYARGAGNGALLPGRAYSSFVFDPGWRVAPGHQGQVRARRFGCGARTRTVDEITFDAAGGVATLNASTFVRVVSPLRGDLALVPFVSERANTRRRAHA